MSRLYFLDHAMPWYEETFRMEGKTLFCILLATICLFVIMVIITVMIAKNKKDRPSEQTETNQTSERVEKNDDAVN